MLEAKIGLRNASKWTDPVGKVKLGQVKILGFLQVLLPGAILGVHTLLKATGNKSEMGINGLFSSRLSTLEKITYYATPAPKQPVPRYLASGLNSIHRKLSCLLHFGEKDENSSCNKWSAFLKTLLAASLSVGDAVSSVPVILTWLRFFVYWNVDNMWEDLKVCFLITSSN